MSGVGPVVSRALETMSALASLHAAVEAIVLASKLAGRAEKAVDGVTPEIAAVYDALAVAIEAAQRAVVVLDETYSRAVRELGE